MFDRDEAQLLFDYDRWANTRLAHALAQLPAPLPAADRLFAHVVGALEIWTERVAGGDYRAVAVWPAVVPYTELLARAERAWEHWRSVLERADAEALAREVRFVNSQGRECADTLADIVRHVVHHGTYHRGQIAQLVRAAGHAPLDLDYIIWTRSRSAAASAPRRGS